MYNKQNGEINEYQWWLGRNDVDSGRDVKLYYYNGVMGRRWRLEGEGYSFWAPDDAASSDDLLEMIRARDDMSKDTPCGPLPYLEGWWTLTLDRNVGTEGLSDRYKIKQTGRDILVTRWNTDRLDSSQGFPLSVHAGSSPRDVIIAA